MESSDAGYLIMRIKEQTAIMLSHDGAFVEVPLAQVPPDARHVGATTSLRRLPEEAPTPDPVRPASGRSAGPLTDWARWLAAAAAILVMLWGGSSAYEAWAYPYHIAVDINPSMVLVFDRQAQLHEIRPRNAEAAEMLADIDMQAVRGTSPEEAVTALVSSAQIHG